jgi:cyclic-di-GMP phosphodiesterase TipF (flagellum assembly factor)
MPRAADILVVLTYAMIAIVSGLAFERLGLMSTTYAFLMGALVFLVAGQVHASVARAQERKAFETEVHELRAANLELAEELASGQTRIEEIAHTLRIEAAERESALFEEVRVLEDLVRRAGAPPVSDTAIPEAVFADNDIDIDIVRDALVNNRVDLYLQPIVGLPQRRTYFYESFTRLRDAEGEVIAPAAFLRAAEDAGLMTEVDNLLLFRCVQIVRRLTDRERRIGIFCNLSIRSLSDEDFFPAFLDFVRQHAELSGSIIFEISQEAFETRDAVAARNMARLADFGFRFSIDHITDLSADPAEMQRAGVRFAKVDGRRLIEAVATSQPIGGLEPGSVAPEDVAGLFARHGVDLIAEKIEEELTVVEILDLDVAFGQGHLFGEPRPVKDDVIDRAAETERLAG